MKIALYSLILPRAEHDFLREWIEHYLSLGVDSIHLYDNGEFSKDYRYLISDGAVWGKKPGQHYNTSLSMIEIRDNFRLLTGEFPVTFTRWNRPYRTKDSQSQITAWRHATSKWDDVDWWLFVDPDEFLNLKQHQSLPQLIEEGPDGVGAWRFTQRVFDRRRFGIPVKEITAWAYDTEVCKTLVRTPIKAFRVHKSYSQSGRVKYARSEVAVIHHYRGTPCPFEKKHGGYSEEPFSNVDTSLAASVRGSASKD